MNYVAVLTYHGDGIPRTYGVFDSLDAAKEWAEKIWPDFFADPFPGFKNNEDPSWVDFTLIEAPGRTLALVPLAPAEPMEVGVANGSGLVLIRKGSKKPHLTIVT